MDFVFYDYYNLITLYYIYRQARNVTNSEILTLLYTPYDIDFILKYIMLLNYVHLYTVYFEMITWTLLKKNMFKFLF